MATLALAPRHRKPASYYLYKLVSLWLPLAFFLLFTLAPFYYMLIVSIKDQQLEVNTPQVFPFWPFHPNWNQYIDLFARTQFPRWALNTTIVACLSTLVSLTFGILAGYALARLRFRGAGLLGIISFVTYLVPQTLLFIPLNIVITRLPVPLFLVTVAFSTVAVGLPLLMLAVPPEKRVNWGPLASWLPGILLLGIGVSLGLWGLTAKGAALDEIELGGATNLSNTLWALVLTYPTFLVPFCTWLLTGYFQSIPRELEESALIDGASRTQAMLRIVVAAGLAGHLVRLHLRLHAELERVHLCAGVLDLDRQSHHPRRRGQRAHPRRRLLLGHADGRRAARLGASRGRVLVLRRQLRLGPDRGRGQRLRRHT